MATLAKLLVELGMKADQFDQALNQSESKLKGWGQRLTGIGQNLTLKATTPIIGLGLASVKAASDLSESLSAVSNVFGDQASSIAGYTGSVAGELGLARQEALAFSVTLGSIYTGAGLTGPALAEVSNDTLQLAADMASFYNIPVPEALAKIQAGLAGETEGLKALGINLSEQVVNQAALNNGISDGSRELTEAEKVMARYWAIQDGAALAQNDFAETSKGLANQQRILSAKFKDSLAVLGQKLLPIMLRVVEVVIKAVDWFTALPDSVVTIILVVGALVAVLGPLLIFIGMLMTAISAIIAIAPLLGTAFTVMLGPIGLIILAIAALVLIFTTDFMGIRTMVFGWVEAIIGYISRLVDWFGGDGFGKIIGMLEDFGKQLISFAEEAILFYLTLPITLADIILGLISDLGGWVDDLITTFSSIPEDIKKFFEGMFDIFFNVGWSIVAGILSGIASLWNTFVGKINEMIDQVGRVWDYINPGSPSKTFAMLGRSMMAGLATGIDGGMGQVAGSVAGVNGALAMTGSTRGAGGGLAVGGGGGGTTINLHEKAIYIQGAGDPEAVADAVVDRLMAANDRVEAGETP